MAGHHHLARTGSACKQRDALANVAGAEYQHTVARGHTTHPHGLVAHGQRLGHGGHFGADTGRNRHAVARGHQHPGRKRAVAGHTNAAPRHTAVRVTRRTRGTNTTGDRRAHGHQLPGGQAFNTLPQRRHLAAELMAHRDRQRGGEEVVAGRPLVDVQIGATHPRRADAQQHLTRAGGRGRGGFGQAQAFARLDFAQGVHGVVGLCGGMAGVSRASKHT